MLLFILLCNLTECRQQLDVELEVEIGADEIYPGAVVSEMRVAVEKLSAHLYFGKVRKIESIIFTLILVQF